MAPLDRAVALAERQHGSVLVGQQLDLDVPRALDIAFAEDPVVTERGLRLASRRRERLLELGWIPNHAHASAAAAGRRLDDEREPDLGRLARRDDGNAGRVRDSLRLDLVAAGSQRVRRGPDPHELGGVHRFREVGVLGEKTVARVNRIGTRSASPRGCALRRTDSSRSRSSRLPIAHATTRCRRERRPRRSRFPVRARRGTRATRSRRDSRRAASGSSLFARVEEVLGVEGALHRGM